MDVIIVYICFSIVRNPVKDFVFIETDVAKTLRDRESEEAIVINEFWVGLSETIIGHIGLRHNFGELASQTYYITIPRLSRNAASTQANYDTIVILPNITGFGICQFYCVIPSQSSVSISLLQRPDLNRVEERRCG